MLLPRGGDGGCPIGALGPAGGEAKFNPAIHSGSSAAVLITVSLESALTVWVPIVGGTGATLTSCTVTKNSLVALKFGLTGS